MFAGFAHLLALGDLCLLLGDEVSRELLRATEEGEAVLQERYEDQASTKGGGGGWSDRSVGDARVRSVDGRESEREWKSARVSARAREEEAVGGARGARAAEE